MTLFIHVSGNGWFSLNLFVIIFQQIILY